MSSPDGTPWSDSAFEVSTIGLELPIGTGAINEMGSPEIITERIVFRVRMLPDTGGGKKSNSHETSKLEKVILTGRTLKPLDSRIRAGLICSGDINGVEGVIEIQPVSQNSIRAITEEFGDRIRIKFSQSFVAVEVSERQQGHNVI